MVQAMSTMSLAALGRDHGPVDASATLQKLFATIPGFRSLEKFFKDWLRLDLAMVAAALAALGVISSGAQQLKGAALQVYGWITRFFTASVSIAGNDRLNKEVVNWIGSQVIQSQKTRILTARSEPIQNDAWTYGRPVRRNDLHHQKRLPIQYLPTFGITWFIHERSLFLVHMQGGRDNSFPVSNDSPDQYYVAPAGNEPLVVMRLGRSVEPIKKFLTNCRDFADQQRESYVTVRMSRDPYHHGQAWDTTILRPMRPLDTVHMEKSTKDDLVLDVTNYLKASTRRFYTNRGIPYRRGYLLHGPPGTGKTSLSLALAGKFGLDLYILHVPSLRDDSELERMFTFLPPQCIVLLEDIDAVGMKRNAEAEGEDDYEEKLWRSRSEGKISLSGLLNVLDGVTSQEGRIVLMTSNVADQLDEALIRPGRIDKMIFMGTIDKVAAADMFMRMYAPDGSEESNAADTCVQLEEAELQKLAEAFGSKIPQQAITPAQLQGYLLNYRHTPTKAIAEIDGWVETEKARVAENKAREEKVKAKKAARMMRLEAKQAAALASMSMSVPSFSAHTGSSGDPTIPSMPKQQAENCTDAGAASASMAPKDKTSSVEKRGGAQLGDDEDTKL